MDRARIASLLIAGIAVVVGSLWLANLFLRYGPIELAPDLWIDYPHFGLDFRAYVDAASRVATEGTPYAPEVIAGPYESGPTGLYYYSPVLAVSLLPVESISFADSSTWWFVAHVVAIGAACALMPVHLVTRALAFAILAFSPAVLKDLIYGNVSTILLLPMVMTWRWLDQPLGSVALAVGVAIRPALGLLLIWQLLRRAWKPAAWTIGAGLVLIAISLPFVGVGGYFDYFDALRNLNVPDASSAAEYDWENHDLGQVVRFAGGSEGATQLARLVSIGFGVGAMLLSLRRDREVGFQVTLMASLIVVPILWDHYLAMLVIPAAFLAERWRPVAIVLPLVTWFPAVSVFVVMLTMVLLFLAPSRKADSREPDETPRSEVEGAPATSS